MLSILCHKKKKWKIENRRQILLQVQLLCWNIYQYRPHWVKTHSTIIVNFVGGVYGIQGFHKTFKIYPCCRWKFNSPWSALAGLKIDASSVSLTLWERAEVKLKQSIWIYLPYNQINKVKTTKRVLFLYNPRWLSVNYSL